METTSTNGHTQEQPVPAATMAAHPTLVRALIAAQRRAKAVAKSAVNTFHKYNYASADAIIDEASECLAAEGLAVFPVSIDRDPSQMDHVWQGEGDEAWIAVPRRIRAVYQLLHESGETREFSSSTPVIPEKGRPEDKAEFGARTENLGYALRDLLLIPREDQAKETPSARDDRSYQQRGPQPTAAPQSERRWMKALQTAVGKLKLGEADANERGLKGKQRDDFERDAKIAYLRWCVGRDSVKSTLDLTDDEATAVIRKAEAGEVQS